MNSVVLDMMTVREELSGLFDLDELYESEDEIDDQLYSVTHAYEAQGASARGPGGRTQEESSQGIGSGRFHKGSGDKPYQHGLNDFLERADYYKKQGATGRDLANLCGCRSTTEYRVKYSAALHDWKQRRAEQARELLDKGMSQKQVAAQFGIRDTSLRSWLNAQSMERVNKAQTVADFLEKQVNEKKMVEVGSSVRMEKDIDASEGKMAEALEILKSKGYQVFRARVPQATNPGKQTTVTVLATPDQQYKDVYKHPEKVQSIVDYTVKSEESGETRAAKKWERPASLDSKRLLIRYADDVDAYGHTGRESDGVIELRRNVPDLDLKGSHYAQVRILVDGNKYLKGMALYSDTIPDGYDVVFNTSKTRAQVDKVLKAAKDDDPDNPFGALLRDEGGQYHYDDPVTGEKKLGLINKTRQEGDWGDWEDKLPSQFLAKQPMKLIDKQLDLAIRSKRAEMNDILSLTNPTVKKKLLDDFAKGADSQAVDLYAAQLPRQKYQVLLPVNTLADNEVYAPGYNDGETVALVRFPHGGLFEIPILKVNNKNPQAISMMGKNPIDAVGVSKRNADILSGADNDGDTVMVIPCNDSNYSDTKIQNKPPLKGLEGFDGHVQYAADYEESRMEKVLDKKTGDWKRNPDGSYKLEKVVHCFKNGKEFKLMKTTDIEMGKISNLIMDMTLAGAGEEDLAAAVRHSMVVIDAAKHHLDYKQSEKDNNIAALKKKYQSHYDENGVLHYGAATLLTRAKSPYRMNKPTGNPHIDPETGKLYYTEKQLTPQTWVDEKGKEHVRQMEVSLLSVKDDASDLIRDKAHPNPKEEAYARYSNALKAMANEARKTIVSTGDIAYNPQAAEMYKDNVDRLIADLQRAEMNAPREKMAQMYSRGVVLAKKAIDPDMTTKDIKKAAQRALVDGRLKYGASRVEIDITPTDWEAIQAGAINKTKLRKILNYADQDKVREYATPKQAVKLTVGQQARIRRYLKNGVSAALIAEQMHVSVSTVNKFREQREGE